MGEDDDFDGVEVVMIMTKMEEQEKVLVQLWKFVTFRNKLFRFYGEKKERVVKGSGGREKCLKMREKER